MKELYLIPKHLYEVKKTPLNVIPKGIIKRNDTTVTNSSIKRKIPKVGERWKVRIPPPSLQITSPSLPNQTPLIDRKGYNENPNIYNHLSLRMSGKEIQRASLILKHFNTVGSVKWNEYGDIYSPISGYNIIDIIHDLIYKETRIDDDKLKDYKFIIDLVSLPTHYIKNTTVKNYVSPLKGGKRRISEWICY